LKGKGVSTTNNEPDFNVQDNTPKLFDMKAISNCVSLQIGILF
jgi:hypothetical protein